MAQTAFDPKTLPTFSNIKPGNIEADIKHILDENRAELTRILKNKDNLSWDSLMLPQEEMNDRLHHYWSPISHLNAVAQTEELRNAYNNAQEDITAYYTELSQNTELYEAVAALAESDEFATLTPAQQKVITNDIRDFKLSGVDLPEDKKNRLTAISMELSKLSTTFSDNLLDATNAWTIHITDESRLEGLPEQAKQLAIDNAKQRNLDGYVFTLEYPSYSTAIRYLRDRDLRKTIYEAYATRASELGPDAGKWDNTQVMEDIMRYRTELARLINFENFAEYSLATKMAGETDEVMDFLRDLVTHSKSFAEQDIKEVSAIAKELDNIDKLEAWDVHYYSHKLQLRKFNFSQEDFRPYFPANKVLQGMFTIVNKLYGITIKEEKGIDVWNPQVQFFTVYDAEGNFRAGFYTDLYARPHKRGGAWMDECLVRFITKDKIQYPVAYLTCNFMRPVDGKPALLTHEDVLTLFHEFGHCLHHMLTKVDVPSVSGINGVPWDAVEYPSQFMENFCWERQALDLFAGHYETGEPFPEDLFSKMLSAKHFQSGMQMIRQLEFSLFDFELHMLYDPDIAQPQVQEILNHVRSQVSILPAPEFNRFQHSFSHIFGGGYAAGYYSYKWAEVLSADTYAAFEENGLFDKKTGQSFLKNVLEVGGVREPMESFIAFRGRKPTVDALLKHSGLTYSEEIPR